MGGRINTPSAKPASAGAEITNHRDIRMCIRTPFAVCVLRGVL